MTDHPRTGARLARRLAVVSLGVLLLAQRPAVAQEKAPAPDLDGLTLAETVDPNVPIDADKLLKVWARRLGSTILLDPQMTGVKIKLLESEVSPRPAPASDDESPGARYRLVLVEIASDPKLSSCILEPRSGGEQVVLRVGETWEGFECKAIERRDGACVVSLGRGDKVQTVTLATKSGPSSITWGVMKKILDFYDLVVEEKESEGHWVMLVHLRRNLPAKAGPPFPVLGPGEPLPKREEIVTSIVRVEHGAGSDIFAVVRGLLVRDVNRVGNILYVKGPETIILVDYAGNVDYYTRVIKQLDVAESDQTTRVVQLRFSAAEDVIPLLEGTFKAKVVGSARTNQLVLRGSPCELDQVEAVLRGIDVKADAPPARFRSAAELAIANASWWRIATAFATIAFLGQTIILRRFRRARI